MESHGNPPSSDFVGRYPLVNMQKTMEKGHVQSFFVCLPEGRSEIHGNLSHWDGPN
jgi:hypothetical protein